MEDIAFLTNETASYEDVAENGCARPVDFESPNIGVAERVDAPVYNPNTHEIRLVPNIIYERHEGGRHPARAYWIGRKIKKAIFGCVKSCTVLKFRNDIDVPWEITDQKAAVKIMSWDKIRNIRHVEDPQKEISALQYLCRDGVHPNVLHPMDALHDDQYLLLFMPYCDSGDLFGFVAHAAQSGRLFPERIARFWFHQILQGLAHLQRNGVCHRDMSLENILVDKMSTAIVMDLGMCLRLPYPKQDGSGSGDYTEGTLRRLVAPCIPCGKYGYMAPEIMKGEAFDGFAIDLWGAGVILFMMLTGLPPYEFPTNDDPRYRQIARGGLERLLRSWRCQVSPEATDLVQNMLLEDPRERLSLSEVREHPWVLDEVPDVQMGEPAPTEGWRY